MVGAFLSAYHTAAAPCRAVPWGYCQQPFPGSEVSYNGGVLPRAWIGSRMSEYPQFSENRPVPAVAPRTPSGEGPSRRLPLLVGVLTLLLGLLILPYVLEAISYRIARGRQRATAEVARTELERLPDQTGRYRLVAQAVAPSVVGIDTVRVVQPRGGLASLLEQPYAAMGEGSGVIIDPKGYILTNYHVIEGAQEAKVKLADGEVVTDVTLVGYDPAADLAVLKISSSGLVAAPWGNSDAMEVGDPVLAIGNPFGFDRTVTAGIISAKDRKLQQPGDLGVQNFLQTDAAVNPGNSGGPLVNLKGEVIGINTAIHGRTYEGISFAIPSHLAQETYDRILKGGRAERGYLGAQLDDLTAEDAQQLHLQNLTGVLVRRVVGDSPAEKAGIEPGDVIVSWNNSRVTQRTELAYAIARTKPGTRVPVRLIRDRQSREVTVEIGAQPFQRQS